MFCRISSGKAANYTNWYKGEPNNSNNGTEHFAHIRPGSTDRKWNDCANENKNPGSGLICDAPFYGLCQFNL